MSSKTIEVTVSPDGSTEIATTGFRGAACQQASRFLEQALGVRTQQQLTSEFFEQTTSITSTAAVQSRANQSS